MIFPVGDDNSSRRIFPFVNLLFILSTIAVWFLQLDGGMPFSYAFSLVPYEVIYQTDLVGPVSIETPEGSVEIPHYPAGVPLLLTLLTSVFLHGGWMHLIGNMLYLYVFGDQIEDYLGHTRYFVFYLLSGVMASLAHVFTDVNSVIHLVGASGAISGVLGAYLICYPANRITLWVWITTVKLPALLVIGFWFLMQLSGYFSPEDGGVAYMAHIGGFVSGIFLVWRFRPEKKRLASP